MKTQMKFTENKFYDRLYKSDSEIYEDAVSTKSIFVRGRKYKSARRQFDEFKREINRVMTPQLEIEPV